MKAHLDLSVDCNRLGHVLIKAGDQILFTAANAREITPFLTRLGLSHEEASYFLTEAIICLEKMFQAYKSKTNGEHA